MEQIYTPKQNYKVLAMCFTYNNAKYIEETLDGFAMQNTNFPFVCLVMDDCSTDGEQDVIKAWMDRECDMQQSETIEIEKSFITIVPHKTNINCTFAFYFLKQNMYKVKYEKLEMVNPWRQRCEYEATCEGDDYWTDPLKLQKQVDFLESHPDYSMCFHTAIQHWEDGRKPDGVFRQIEDREYSGEELFAQWTVATASVMLRRSVLESDIYKRARNNNKFIYGDIITWLSAAHEGKVLGMSDVMSIYRRQETGAVFKYDLKRIKQQAYHSLEIYTVFGKQYKLLSKQKFFKYALEAFFGQKVDGDIDYTLLMDLIKYTPKHTFNALVSMVTGKIRK